MSSWVRKGTEDNPPSNAGGLSRYEENMTTPTTTSTETTTVAMEGNTQTSNNVAPVKSTDMSSRRVQWYHRKQPLVPSTSSDHVGLDSVFNFGKTQAKPQGIAADETETSVQQDTSSCATESKGAAAADLTSKPDHGGLAPSTSDEMRTAAMSTPTGQRGSNEHAPSEVADIYKALETLTHSQTNQTTRQESIKPFPTFVVGAEASFSNVLPAIPTKQPRRIYIAPNELMLLWKAIMDLIPKEYFQKVYADILKLFSNNKSIEPDIEDMLDTGKMLHGVFNTLVSPCPCKARIPGLFSLSDIDTSISDGEHMMNVLNSAMGIDPPFTMDDLVLVSDMLQLANIMNITHQVDDKSILRHLSWLFVVAHAAVADPAAVLLVFHGSKHHAEEERPRFCASQVEPSYKLLISAMASAAHFSEDEQVAHCQPSARYRAGG
ncbi:hypothetical protein HPB49_012172 [Dermacentor silvarum]|uniref:Uncharacterized protein n=1 Tax=Dermacentor silvarum TaxID=543639 RepID=A0ACB8CEZ3_DERSI|nr:hypothetical protein HPB49_012172 [Dermacentor silvarum]